MVRLWVVVLCGMLASIGRAASADTVSDAAARGHFSAGSAYFTRGEYGRAVKEFIEAQREVDSPALDYNLGLAYERLGDSGHAVRSYERFLARTPSAANRTEIETKITRLSQHVGSLDVDPPSTTESVTVDDEPYLQGEQRFTEGKHRVGLVKDGATIRRVTVSVRAGEHTHVTTKSLHPSGRWWIGVVVGSVLVAGVAVGLGVGLGTRDAGSPRQGSLGQLPVP
jgi:tetratricopeptide (TPR) repeat protein